MKLMGPTILVKLTNHRAVMTGTLPTCYFICDVTRTLRKIYQNLK